MGWKMLLSHGNDLSRAITDGEQIQVQLQNKRAKADKVGKGLQNQGTPKLVE
jgi:hypothetical protein